MTFLYLDSSAWVKPYYRERGSEFIKEMISGEVLLVCSVLGIVEVVATLARKRKAQEISLGDFAAKVAELEQDWKKFLQIELTLENLDAAKDVAAQFALRGADAVHFAALRSLDGRVSRYGHKVVLVASDRELKGAAESSGIKVLDPELDSVV